jgi:hypothetical protein
MDVNAEHRKFKADCGTVWAVGGWQLSRCEGTGKRVEVYLHRQAHPMTYECPDCNRLTARLERQLKDGTL